MILGIFNLRIPSSPGGKARKKKRRTSERDERENYQAASSSTSVFNFSASQSCGASPEKKKKPVRFQKIKTRVVLVTVIDSCDIFTNNFAVFFLFLVVNEG